MNEDTFQRLRDAAANAKNTREIRTAHAAIITALADLHRSNHDSKFGADDQRRWDELTELVDTKLGPAVLDFDRREEFGKEMLANAGPGNTIRGDRPYGQFNTSRRTDPFDPTNTDSMRSRALQAVETCAEASDESKQSATKLVEQSHRDDLRGMPEHVLMTTAPEYVNAFRKYLADPEGYRADLTAEENAAWRSVNTWNRRQNRGGAATFGESRAAMSLTAGNGGVLVPQFLDPSINLINAGAYSDVRQIADVIAITVDQWDGVTSAGVTAEWLAENTEAADATPTFVGPTIPVHKAAAWLYGSYEVLMDSGFDQVAFLLSDAKARLEAAAHVSGNGSGQPYGLINVLSGSGPAITGTSSTNGVAGTYDLSINDFYAMDDALPARWRPNAKFLMAKPTTNTIRRRASELPSQTAWSDIGHDAPPSLIGYPVHRNENITSTLVSGTVQHVAVLGDFKQYKIIDRVGMEILYEPIVKSTGSGRPLGAAGWFGFWRTGANTVTSSSFKVLAL